MRFFRVLQQRYQDMAVIYHVSEMRFIAILMDKKGKMRKIDNLENKETTETNKTE